MNLVRIISFDVTGTLLKPTQLAGFQYAEATEKYFGVEADGASMQNAFLKNYANELKARPCFGALHQVPTSGWWFSVFSNCLMESEFGLAKVPNYDTRLRSAFQDVFDNFKWTLLPGTIDTLQGLKSVNFSMQGPVKIAAISNSDERTTTILSDNGILQYFDVVVTSVEAKCQKPDAAIFDLALEKMGVPEVTKEQVLHVGNSYKKDYLAALDLGMKALLLREEGNQHERVLDESHGIVDIKDVLAYVRKLNSES